MARIVVGDDFDFSDPMGLMPAPKAPGVSAPRRGKWSTDEIRRGIVETADELGVDPVDVATAISYETGGTFDPVKAGPHTKYGRHRGLIQFGEPQAAQYGVDWSNPVASQLGRGGAVTKYLRAAGVRPGTGLLDIYSAINAGRVGRYGASDAAAGGAPGTVADKVQNQMAGHRRKAMALIGGGNIDTMATAGTSRGNGANRIVIDDDQGFRPSDPMGLFAGQENPLARAPAPPLEEEPEPEPVVQPDLPDLKLEELNREQPGQWQRIPADQLNQWKKDWIAKQPGILSDTGQLLKSGWWGLGAAVREIVNQIPKVGPSIVESLDAIDKWQHGKSGEELFSAKMKEAEQAMSAPTRAARQKAWWDSEKGTFGPALYDPRSWYSGAVESIPMTAATMGPSMMLARGAFTTAMASGLSREVAAAQAARTAAIAGGIGEGLIGGGSVAAQVREDLDRLPDEIWDRSEAVKSLTAGGMSREQAIKTLKEDAASQSFVLAGVADGLLGGLGDRVVAKIAGEGVSGNILKRIVTGAMRDIPAEALEESGQNAAEQIVQNLAKQKVNPKQDLFEGVSEAVVSGAALGGAMGGAMGGAAGAFSAAEQATEGGAETEQPASPPVPPVAPVKEPPKAGPLSEAVKHGERRTTEKIGGEFVISDPPMTTPEGEQLPAGPMHGMTVQLDPDQGEVDENMRRVILPDGQRTLIGVNNLQPKTVAEQPAPVQEAAGAIPAGAPALGSGVTVKMPTGGTFPAMIDSYTPEGEAVVVDQDGEVYSVPLESLVTPEAPQRPAETRQPAEAEAQPTQERAPAAAPAAEEAEKGVPLEKLPAAPPRSAETKTTLPPAEVQKPALERFPGPPEVGQSVIVDAPEIGERFAARVQSYEGDEALVRRPDGSEIQVPLTTLFVDKRQPKEFEAEEQKLRPPAEREKPAPSPTRRTVTVAKGQSRTVEMPDELHSRLYDLGQARQHALRMQGVSRLDLDRVNPSAQEAIARELHVSPESAGQIADDFRYRVERAAKQARSELPQKVQRINPELLKRRQSEFARAQQPAPEAASAAAAGEAAAAARPALAPAAPATPMRDWWDTELTPTGRKLVLDRAGVKRSTKTLWHNFPINLQSKIAAVRPAMDAEFAAAVEPEAASATPVDVHAHEAATSPQNELKPPTPAQQAAENFKMGHTKLSGLPISITHAEGAAREGKSPSGKKWKRKLRSHYGYILGTRTGDKDRMDVFIKPGTVPADMTDASQVFVVDQQKPGNRMFDEHKVMVGYDTEEEARQAYLEHYPKGWEKTGLRAITPTSVGDLKQWLKTGDTTQPFAVRGLKPPIEKPTAPADLSPLEKRASDVYSRIWDQAVAAPTDRQAYLHWWEQIAELIVNPGRYHRVVEEENPLGLKIGDEATIEDKTGLVASITTQGIYQGALLANPEGYPVWRTIATKAAPTEAPPRAPRKEATERPAPAATLPEGAQPTAEFQRGPYPRAGERPIGEIAKRYVVGQGKRTGNEWVVGFDGQGNVRLHQEGTDKSGGTTPEFDALLLDATADAVAHHNHPRSTTASLTDAAHLIYPGLSAIWAHGHDGTSTRISLSDHAREALRERRARIKAKADAEPFFLLIDRIRRRVHCVCSGL
jgi:hypothetical protein